MRIRIKFSYKYNKQLAAVFIILNLDFYKQLENEVNPLFGCTLNHCIHN